jgi:hypothetical protein
VGFFLLPQSILFRACLNFPHHVAGKLLRLGPTPDVSSARTPASVSAAAALLPMPPLAAVTKAVLAVRLIQV